MVFVGRTNEIRAISDLLHDAQRGVTQFLVLFGRRRVGKSTLVGKVLDEHARTHRAVTFNATLEGDTVLRERFHRQLAAADVQPRSSSWDDMLGAALNDENPSPLVLTIDEAPYLMSPNSGWASILQHEWDRAHRRERPAAPTIILTGSAIATMSSIISSGGPLYGRPTRTIRLDPLGIIETHELLNRPEPRRTLEAHAACGGYPLLIDRWDPAVDAEANLLNLAGDTFGPLAANANALLLDLPDAAGHRRVLTAIGRGATKFAKISDRAPRPERSLKTLEGAGFIEQHVPVGGARAKNLRYRLADGYLRFWFDIVDRNQQFIDSGQGATAIRSAMPRWTTVLAETFEREARHHATRLVAKGDLPEATVGEWWRDTGVQAQIDVVGVVGRRWAFVGEAKCSLTFDRTALQQLERSIESSGEGHDRLLSIGWSLTGATKDVTRLRSLMHQYTIADIVSDTASSDSS